MEALEAAHSILIRDARHRVSKLVDLFRMYMRRGAPFERFSDAPHYGIVSSTRELPCFKVSPHGSEASGLELLPLHYVDGGKVFYFPDSSPGLEHYTKSSLFLKPGNTYLPSLMLMRALWDKLQQDETRLPEILGQELVYADNLDAELQALRSAKFHVRMASYTQVGTPVSTGRINATGFVAEFGFPGEEPQVINTLEVEASLIRQIEEGQSNDGDAVLVDAEETEFLRRLKERCYLIQKEHGPFAAKYAWETYKSTKRFLLHGDMELAS